MNPERINVDVGALAGSISGDVRERVVRDGRPAVRQPGRGRASPHPRVEPPCVDASLGKLRAGPPRVNA